MNLRRGRIVVPSDGSIEYLIRWGLHGVVKGAEPSPEVWERIERCIKSDAGGVEVQSPTWRRALVAYKLNLLQAARYLRGLSEGNWQHMATAHSLAAETSAFTGLGFQWC